VRAALACTLALVAGCGEPAAVCDPFCDQLSALGILEDEALIPYAINTPLFSDYTAKDRALWLPPGTQMTWHDSAAFAMPPGAMLVKTFRYPHDRRDPAAGSRPLETRILLREATGWLGATYVYDDDGRDATLTIAGATLETSWIHDDGSERTNRYAVPNRNQCKNCHAEADDAIEALGPKARHLNTGDQLQQLIARGVLVGAPAPELWPRAPVASDPTTGSLEERARAWLDINCASCHNPRGPARTSGLFLEARQLDPTALGVCKPPVAAGRGSGGRAYGIVPGAPDASILVFRIESTEADVKMPELGRNLVDAEGVALIRAWIAAMPGSCD